MKIAALIARLLLGLIFFVFGLNGFLHFLPMLPQPGLAGEYFGVLLRSGYLPVVFLLQLFGGVLLLAGQYIPLALVLLGPVLVNIVLFHLLMAPSGLPLALVVVILWFILFFRYRMSFAPLFSNPRP